MSVRLPQLAPTRSCSDIDCSLCCKLPSVTFDDGYVKQSNEWCEHCTKPGCGIYETRDSICRDFHCMWRYDCWPESLDPKSTGCVVLFEQIIGKDARGDQSFPAVRVHEARPGASQALEHPLHQLWDMDHVVIIYTPDHKVRLVGWIHGTRVLLYEQPAHRTGVTPMPTVNKPVMERYGANWRKIRDIPPPTLEQMGVAPD